MVGLLDLPSELLFEIISLVLSSPPGFRQNEKRHRPNWNTSRRNIWCLPPLELFKTSTALDLLLINQRFCTEAREYLAKASQTFDADVDVEIVDDHWLWPTSRFVLPRKPGQIIRRLNVDVVPCCTEEERHLQTSLNAGGFRALLHSPLPFTRNRIICELMAPLVEFLLEGDVDRTAIGSHFNRLPCKDDDAECDTMKVPITRIDTIAISIDTSKYKTGNEVLSKEDVPFRTISGLGHLDFERLYPVDSARSKHYLDTMRRYITTWTSDYGASKVAKKVGKIQLYLDGNMWSEFDFDQHA